MLVYGSPTADVIDLSLMSADLPESRDDIFFFLDAYVSSRYRFKKTSQGCNMLNLTVNFLHTLAK